MAAIDVQVTASPTVEITHPNVIIGTCADATVGNSDSSYSTTVASGGTLVLPDTPISANGDLVVNQPSTIAKNITLTVNGIAPISTTVVSENEVDLEAAIAAVGLTIGVYSDAGHTTPITTWSWGDTVYLKATATGYTPDEHIFFVSDGVKMLPIVTQASGQYTWIVESIPDRGSLTVYCQATDTVEGVSSYASIDVTINAYYLDIFPSAESCIAVRLESSTYTGPLFDFVRNSDFSVKSFYADANGLISMDSEDGSGTSLATWLGNNSGNYYKLYDQTGNGNHWEQATYNDQYEGAVNGVFLTHENGLAAPTNLDSGSRNYTMTGFSGHAVLDVDMAITTTRTTFSVHTGAGTTTYAALSQVGSASSSVNSNYGSPTIYADNVAVSPLTRESCSLAHRGLKIITHEGANTTNANWVTLSTFGRYFPSASFIWQGVFQFHAYFTSDQSSVRTKRFKYLQNFYKCI